MEFEDGLSISVLKNQGNSSQHTTGDRNVFKSQIYSNAAHPLYLTPCLLQSVKTCQSSQDDWSISKE
jgi:hypothetical protein